MPISRVGEIAYQPAAPPGGIRLQANPPVCNRCWHEITPQKFGGPLAHASGPPQILWGHLLPAAITHRRVWLPPQDPREGGCVVSHSVYDATPRQRFLH